MLRLMKPRRHCSSISRLDLHRGSVNGDGRVGRDGRGVNGDG